MARGVISYPIPPYSNPAIEPQFYLPSRFVISAITLGLTTIVTTSVNHNYVIGQEVRLIIPQKYGSFALNETFGNVISIPNPNQVEIDIDSTLSDAFVPNPTFIPFESQTPPQILAIGDVNTGQINIGRSNQSRFIPGSFIDISPN